VKIVKITIVLFSLLLLAACQSAMPEAQQAVSVGRLRDEYEVSRAAARSKYDGKEITVSGYAEEPSTMPQSEADQGAVLMGEIGRDVNRPVLCWFSPQQATEFSKIKGGEHLVVKGVFNGEERPELRFCKLVKVE
jgi:hypothetical protein